MSKRERLMMAVVEAAPRDGTAVLLWAPDYADVPGIGRWNEIIGAWDADIGCMEDGPSDLPDECDGPTHWRPFPAAPQEDKR